MRAFRGPKTWLWRWRRNPLRRRSDALEAWVVLVAWTVTVIAGVLTGLAATHTIEQSLTRERAEWRPVVARLTEDVGKASTAAGSGGRQVWAGVRWTAPDGSTRSGRTRVAAGSTLGTPVTVWTDQRGLLVTRPASASETELRASLIGMLVGFTSGTVPLVCGRFVCGRLERRRMDQWDEDWARFGPMWGRMTG